MFPEWQSRGRYMIVWHGGSWMLSWHAPWCWFCSHRFSGWPFRLDLDEGYASGLGFELSWCGRRVRDDDEPSAVSVHEIRPGRARSFGRGEAGRRRALEHMRRTRAQRMQEPRLMRWARAIFTH